MNKQLGSPPPCLSNDRRYTYKTATHICTMTHLQEHPGDESRAVVGPDVPSEIRAELFHAPVCHCVSDTAGREAQHAARYGLFGLRAYVISIKLIQRPVSDKVQASKVTTRLPLR